MITTIFILQIITIIILFLFLIGNKLISIKHAKHIKLMQTEKEEDLERYAVLLRTIKLNNNKVYIQEIIEFMRKSGYFVGKPGSHQLMKEFLSKLL